MIESKKFSSPNFNENFQQLEKLFVDELEQKVVSTLVEKRTIVLPGTRDEVLEFAGRTNYKLRLKRPNKNVWSVPLQTFRESIRKVLREGKLTPLEQNAKAPRNKSGEDALATLLLLHILPEEEYYLRSFVGNQVHHPTLGEGKVVRITDSGNVEVAFAERVVRLKPDFVQLTQS